MSLKQSDVDLAKWSIIFVFLWILTEIKGYPCANMSCLYAIQAEDGGMLNLNSIWVTVLSTQGSITQTKADARNETIYLTQTTKGTINEEPLFCDNISKQLLKIILVIGLSFALLIISIAIVRKCYKCYHKISWRGEWKCQKFFCHFLTKFRILKDVKRAKYSYNHN